MVQIEEVVLASKKIEVEENEKPMGAGNCEN